MQLLISVGIGPEILLSLKSLNSKHQVHDCKATSYKGHRGKTENWTFKKTWHNQNSAQLQQYRSLCRLVMVVGLFIGLVFYKFWRLCKLPIDGEISPASAKSERFLQTRNKNLFLIRWDLLLLQKLHFHILVALGINVDPYPPGEFNWEMMTPCVLSCPFNSCCVYHQHWWLN